MTDSCNQISLRLTEPSQLKQIDRETSAPPPLQQRAEPGRIHDDGAEAGGATLLCLVETGDGSTSTSADHGTPALPLQQRVKPGRIHARGATRRPPLLLSFFFSRELLCFLREEGSSSAMAAPHPPKEKPQCHSNEERNLAGITSVASHRAALRRSHTHRPVRLTSPLPLAQTPEERHHHPIFSKNHLPEPTAR